jgi:hypothetical protein
MDTAKSKFTEALAHFWNDYAAHRNIALIICGSAAGWITKNILRNKGGLHNRITRLIKLQPFTLSETAAYLAYKRVNLNHYDITTLYMVMGGVPYYLNEVQRGLSAAQNIDKICFHKQGLLRHEFSNLFDALFFNATPHKLIIDALASKQRGLSRSEIVKQTKLTDGGAINRVLDELKDAAFIDTILPFGKAKKETLYRLTDPYTLFYLKFIRQHRKAGYAVMRTLYNTSNWKSWSGYAFENICLLHLPAIRKKLGIQGVYTETSGYIIKGGKNTDGVQIDFLIDWADRIIHLCEVKFYDAPFIITKEYAAKLRLRISQF